MKKLTARLCPIAKVQKDNPSIIPGKTKVHIDNRDIEEIKICIDALVHFARRFGEGPVLIRMIADEENIP